MITVHHLNNSRSQRVVWMLEELGLPYEIKKYQRDPKTNLAPPELKEIHPLGKSPVLTDGTRVLAESSAILEYLVDTYDREGRFRPAPGSEDFLKYRYWMHYAEGSAMPPLLLSLIFGMIPRQVPFLVRPVAKAISKGVQNAFIGPQLKLHLAFINGELAKAPWFAGESFSAVDVQMSFPLEAFQVRGGLGQNAPYVAQMLEKIHARPAYQRALAKGGAFSLMS